MYPFNLMMGDQRPRISIDQLRTQGIIQQQVYIKIKKREVKQLEYNQIKQHNNCVDKMADTYATYRQMCKDLQFIQMLGNPRYVIELFDRGYFYSKEFKDYLNGLKSILKKPKIMRLVKYPEGLYMFEQMLKKGFVEMLEIPELRNKFILRALKRNLKFKGNMRRWRDWDIDKRKAPEEKQQECGEDKADELGKAQGK